MSGSWVAAGVLSAVAVAELVAVVVLALLLARARRSASRLRDQLERPSRPRPRTAAERAMKAVVETATRVREQGVSGLLMSSLEDLSRWATEDRAEIARVAGPDGTVTILFSDIEDSTALNERLGDAKWVRVLGRHDEIVRRVVRRRAGHVVKTQGDGFMVVFGDPSAAAHAAIDIQDAFGPQPSRAMRGVPIKIRIGMHCGTVVAREGDYFGRNVAMAARVAAEAVGGEILVSDELREDLTDEEGLLFEPRGEVELKGLADRHVLWQLRPAQ